MVTEFFNRQITLKDTVTVSFQLFLGSETNNSYKFE